jgi:hypothetical protein
MHRILKGAAAYWVVGCLLAGAAMGAHESRCPNDPDPSVSSYLASIATWPAGITWAMINPKLSPCKAADSPPRS